VTTKEEAMIQTIESFLSDLKSGKVTPKYVSYDRELREIYDDNFVKRLFPTNVFSIKIVFEENKI
jgi:hypothetical protein